MWECTGVGALGCVGVQGCGCAGRGEHAVRTPLGIRAGSGCAGLGRIVLDWSGWYRIGADSDRSGADQAGLSWFGTDCSGLSRIAPIWSRLYRIGADFTPRGEFGRTVKGAWHLSPRYLIPSARLKNKQ